MLFFSAIVSIMYQASVSGSPKPAFMKKKTKTNSELNRMKKCISCISEGRKKELNKREDALPCVMPPKLAVLSPEMHNSPNCIKSDKNNKDELLLTQTLSMV